jgi:hypothetical protein
MIGKALGFARWVTFILTLLNLLFNSPFGTHACRCGHPRRDHPLFYRACYHDACMCRAYQGKESYVAR